VVDHEQIATRPGTVPHVDPEEARAVLGALGLASTDSLKQPELPEVSNRIPTPLLLEPRLTLRATKALMSWSASSRT
jgi:hypothetical protein